MIQLTNSVEVSATREAVWKLISDFEGAWVQSNPDHEETIVISKYKRAIHDDFAWWHREKVGVVTGEFIAKMHDVSKQQAFSWTTLATYEFGCMRFKVEQGGTFLIEDGEGAKLILRHDLWGRVLGRVKGPITEWIAVSLLGQKKAISKHNLTELLYFKKQLEADAAA
jgi:carbon monoxide dehydrogenase subunit G